MAIWNKAFNKVFSRLGVTIKDTTPAPIKQPAPKRQYHQPLATDEKLKRVDEKLVETKIRQEAKIERKKEQANKARERKEEQEKRRKLKEIEDSTKIDLGASTALEKVDFFNQQVEYDIKTKAQAKEDKQEKQVKQLTPEELEEVQNEISENEIKYKKARDKIEELEALAEERELDEYEKKLLLYYKEQSLAFIKKRNQLYDRAPELRDPEEFIKQNIG